MKLEGCVFSCDYDENDIDQAPNFIRADGEIVANTEDAMYICKGLDIKLAKRITLCLNYFEGCSETEIRELLKLKYRN